MEEPFIEENSLSKCFPEGKKLYGICKSMRVQGKPQESYMTYTENDRKWFEFIEVRHVEGQEGKTKRVDRNQWRGEFGSLRHTLKSWVCVRYVEYGSNLNFMAIGIGASSS
jgi:hypothetical protein